MISAVSSIVAQSFQSAASRSAGPLSDAPEEKKPAAPESSSLNEEEKKQVAQLKKIDREVRAHEQAHKNAGGQYAGSASFGYQVGPDGKRYAVSGEVPIDIAPIEGDPAATVAKMTAIAAAALAPAKPSGQDRRVAAQAISLRGEAQSELTQESRKTLSAIDSGGEEPAQAISINASSIAAYGTGAVNNDEKPTGNILDFLS
ncbi:MAG: hypothetical protein L3J58_00160 [Emcibacter sp.]|nr:hypothetical protein [Emcibacter sp.]